MTKLDLIHKMLEGVPGAHKDGGAVQLAEHPEVSVYIALPSEVLAVQRVARVAAGGDLTYIETHKGETYVFATDLVAGIKFGAGDGKAARTAAGFR